MSAVILPETFQFLELLKNNNNREWFNDNKNLYLQAHENVIEFVDEIIEKLSEIDKEVGKLNAKKALFRIYRDTRFGHNKDPYKTNFGASLGIKGSGKSGYYIHIEPGKSFIGGGIYHPESPILKKIRQDISVYSNEFKTIIENPNFKKNFGKLSEEEKLVKVPNGFDKEHPMADFLKLKNFVALQNLQDTDLTNNSAVKEIVEVLKYIQPLNQFINTAIEEN